MRIIDLLAEAGQAGASVADIAATTGIAKSSAALICGVLEEEKLAGRSDGRYRLGPRFLTLARDYLSTVDRLDEFYAEVRRQPTLAQESARLAILEGTEVIYLARYEAGRPLRLTGQIGDRFPATVTATGKALLSTLSDGVVKDRYREQVLPRYTERSIQTLPQLLEDLALCRERGYAMDDEETNFGFVCFAIPVIDTPGSPARFSVSTTMSKQRADEVSPGVVVAELVQVADVFRDPLVGQSF